MMLSISNLFISNAEKEISLMTFDWILKIFYIAPMKRKGSILPVKKGISPGFPGRCR
jgi:hypothetical protein